MILSMVRSVCKSDCTLPLTTKATSPGFTCAPSSIKTSISNDGSNAANTRRATSIPARIPSSLTRSLERPISSAGMQHNVVCRHRLYLRQKPMQSGHQSVDREFSYSRFIFTIFLITHISPYQKREGNKIIAIFVAWSAVHLTPSDRQMYAKNLYIHMKIDFLVVGKQRNQLHRRHYRIL